MPNKKPIKKIFESASIEAADAHPELRESAQGKQPDEVKNETTESIPAASPSEEMSVESSSQQEDAESSGEEHSAAEEVSPDNLLDDVRRSLMEEEVEQSQQESKWWHRIGRKRKTAKPKEPEETVEIDLPSMSISADLAEDQAQKQEPERQPDEMDNLIDMLIAENEPATAESTVESSGVTEEEAPPASEPAVDIEKLKEQAFRPRTPDDEPEHDVRSVALEGGEEVFVEVESQVANPVEERLSAFENALRPYRWYINIALAVFGLVVTVFVSLILFNIYQQSRPQPVKPASDLPYPTSVSLPGGWSFQLGQGSLQDGKWEPSGPEWLEGTEVCRWVALPWSRQLEAVVRTLNPKDPIELTMSNNDKLIYNVYSIRQLSPAEMQKLDSNSPCLLVILTQPDTDDRWVLTAVP